MEGAAGATRMGSRSSTRHGGPVQVFVGPVRKWRKLWSPVTPSTPSPSAARVLLYKWTPITPSTGGVLGSKEDAAVAPEETPSRPVRYIPVAALLQKRKEEDAKKAAAAAEEAEALARIENDNQMITDTAEDKTEDKIADVDNSEPPSDPDPKATS